LICVQTWPESVLSGHDRNQIASLRGSIVNARLGEHVCDPAHEGAHDRRPVGEIRK
jgi:hypothetical protein